MAVNYRRDGKPLAIRNLSKLSFEWLAWHLDLRYAPVMEESEIPTEHLHEGMHHSAERASQSWIMGVALSAALLSVLAAVSGLLSGHHANEAMIEQMKASDAWSHYQAKGIKSAVLGSKLDFRRALKQPVAPKDETQLEVYAQEQEEIASQAKELAASSSRHLAIHQIFARAVTFFQVAIGIAAIAALTRKRAFSLVFGACGMVFLGQGLLK
jgi:hypothetical protein